MRHSLASLMAARNSLASEYSRFDVARRLLLTGHSHQAWPDVAAPAMQRAFDDAALLVDHKWERAFRVADRVRAGFARLLDDREGEITLVQNTHEALVRFLSAVDLRRFPRLVTSDGEFHTARRQLMRLQEEGVSIERVEAGPDLCAKMLESLQRARPAAVVLSTVMYKNAYIVQGVEELAVMAHALEVPLLLDVYHHLNVVPFSLRGALRTAFVTGGGYKYCQLGEGNCFLRVPAGCMLRPVFTGWFAEFALLGDAHGEGPPQYPAGNARFAGSTYDPVSHYRAAAVFDFFVEQGLEAALLRAVSQSQIRHLAAAFDACDFDPSRIRRDRSLPLERTGGFLSLHAEDAGAVASRLAERGVFADARGSALRFGPAPYLSMTQLDTAMAALAECVR
jgi:kynureninase